MLLTREQAQAADRFEMVEVDVTEWGSINAETGKPEKTTVFVRELSAREKDQYEQSLVTVKKNVTKMNMQDMRARMAVLVCCDAQGKRIFRDDDVEWLTKKAVRPLSRIYNAAKELNDLSGEDEEELLKN